MPFGTATLGGVSVVNRRQAITGRPGKGVLDCPATMKALRDDVIRQPKQALPFANGMRLTIEGNDVICTRVIGLSELYCPTTVLRLIVSIDIDSVDGVLGAWTWTHVGDEVGESVIPEPTLAHGYSTSSVARKIPVILVSATCLHPTPRHIYGSPAHGMCLPQSGRKFQPKTPATLDMPRKKRRCCGWRTGVITTRTNAIPALGMPSLSHTNDRQTAEGLAGQINNLWHKRKVA